jgi:hypothetical protein
VSPMAGANPPDPVSTERKSFTHPERKAGEAHCQAWTTSSDPGKLTGSCLLNVLTDVR